MAPQYTSSDSIVKLLVKQPQILDFEEKQQMVLQVQEKLKAGRESAVIILVTSLFFLLSYV